MEVFALIINGKEDRLYLYRTEAVAREAMEGIYYLLTSLYRQPQTTTYTLQRAELTQNSASIKVALEDGKVFAHELKIERKPVLQWATSSIYGIHR